MPQFVDSSPPLIHIPPPGVAIGVSYIGHRTQSSCVIWICAAKGVQELQPRTPEAFDWGAEKRGARQVAVAVLAHWAGGDDWAEKHAEAFARNVVAKLPMEGWRLTSAQIAMAVLSMAPANK